MAIQEVNLKDFDININDFSEKNDWQETVQAAQVLVAQQALAYEQSQKRLLRPNILVDNRPTSDIHSVKYGGKIVYTDPQNIISLMDYLVDEYDRYQADDTGFLKSTASFMMNQRGVDPRLVGEKPFRVGDSIWFLATAPYARYVEQGLPGSEKGRKGYRVMQNLSLRAKRRYGANFHVDFKYKMVSFVKPSYRYSAIKKRTVYDSEYVKSRGIAIRPAIRIRIKTGFTYH